MAVPATVTEFALDALSMPLATFSVSTRLSSPPVLPSSRSAPVNNSALALSGVIVKVLGSAVMAGAVAVPLLPSCTAATDEMLARRVVAACTKVPLMTCAVAVSV